MNEPNHDSDPTVTSEPISPELARLRNAVHFMYDLQQLRIGGGNRANRVVKTTQLDEHDKAFMEQSSKGLKALEVSTLKEIKLHLKPFPIAKWLLEQKGVGPTLAGVIVSTVDVHKAPTVSSLWSYAGLDVDSSTGRAVRKTKGQKGHHNPFLKAKMVKVLGDCFIKANSPWRKFYDDYKHRKQSQVVPTCMGCKGTGKYESTPCSNCGGKGGPAPWGASDAHRHQAAVRYMIKMFLAALWEQWRTLEGLSIRPPYAEEYLNKTHHVSP